MGNFFHTILYVPIYNLLVFLVSVIPGGDIGLAIIGATLIVKLILWPLSMSAARAQKAMKAMDPEMKAIRETYKEDKEKQMSEMMALYKKYDVHPAAGFLTIFIQLPIIIGLYWVFRTEALPKIDPSLLYSFVHAPALVSPLFLGLLIITAHNIPLAILAGLTQLAQAWYAIPVPPASAEVGGSPGADFARTMALQARFMLPIIIGIVAYASGAIALYFITSNIVALVQEFVVRRGKTKIAPVSL
ncbi:MAG: 60 kDa inner rane insertion protein preprotein translocase subunit YidC [Parcubacteria group bacterium]|nr:60 kDa inner rane insertion protein preprotein translocase subunit YidC [Parcubacteria group bacterium]